MNVLPLLLVLAGSLPADTVAAADIDGHRLALPVKGKTTCLIFLATECPIANRLTPEMGRIAADHKDVAFFMVYPDSTNKKADIRKHVREFRVPGTIIPDPRQVVARFAKATVTPEAAVYTPAGKLAYHGRINDLFTEHNVAIDKAPTNDLRDALAAVREGRPIATPYVDPIGCAIAFVKDGGAR